MRRLGHPPGGADGRRLISSAAGRAHAAATAEAFLEILKRHDILAILETPSTHGSAAVQVIAASAAHDFIFILVGLHPIHSCVVRPKPRVTGAAVPYCRRGALGPAGYLHGLGVCWIF